MNKITRKTFVFLATLAFAVLASSAALAAAANYQLFGDSALTSPGYNSVTAAQIRSDGSIAPNYGGVDFVIPAGLTVADLDTLSTDYQFVAGGCGGGSPRFQVNVVTPSGTKNLQVYLGAAPNYTGCSLNTWANTSNLAVAANQVDATQLGGGFYMTYADAQAAYGAYEITGVQIVADGSWAVGGTQTVQVDNVKINNVTYTFESANSCKNGGWQQFTSAPGPFVNQGQCVSYFAKGGQ
jgi:hypothetical protein